MFDIERILREKDYSATLTTQPIADTHATSGVVIALAHDDRADVDAVTEAAIAAGGRELHGPEDLGFMYSRAFEDLDGHGFGPMWMDPAAAAGAFEPAETSDACTPVEETSDGHGNL